MMTFHNLNYGANTMHLPDAFRSAEEKASVIRDLQGQLETARGDDVQSLTNRIRKAKSIGVRK